jgi:hypothetical protein
VGATKTTIWLVYIVVMAIVYIVVDPFLMKQIIISAIFAYYYNKSRYCDQFKQYNM